MQTFYIWKSKNMVKQFDVNLQMCFMVLGKIKKKFVCCNHLPSPFETREKIADSEPGKQVMPNTFTGLAFGVQDTNRQVWQYTLLWCFFGLSQHACYWPLVQMSRNLATPQQAREKCNMHCTLPYCSHTVKCVVQQNKLVWRYHPADMKNNVRVSSSARVKF